MATIIDLAKKRTSIKNQTLKFEIAVNNHASVPLSVSAVQVSLERLGILHEQLQGNHDDIVDLCSTDTEIATQDDAFAVVEKIILSTKAKLLDIQAVHDAANPTNPPSTTSFASASNMRHPPIPLPTFSGDYEDWTSFEDLFRSSIDKDTILSDAQKLQYLKSSLKGEAAKLVKSIQVTNQNYAEAWTILKERYANEREIVSALLKRLFNQMKLTKESASGLKSLLDTTTECVRILKALKRKVHEWDDILVHIVVERMDPETRRHWAISLKGTSCPTFKELCEFIDQHVRGLLASGASTSKPSNPVKADYERRQASSHHVAAKGKCVVCNDSHQIYHCDKFKLMSLAQREIIVKTNSLCFNCLHGNHSAKQCKSSRKCRKCNKLHNTLLHKFESDKENDPSQSVTSNAASTNSFGTEATASRVLLSTALVHVKDQHGTNQVCRALLDPGSESTFITEDCAKALGLARKKVDVSVTGLSTTSVGTARGQVMLHVSSLVHNVNFNVDALILHKVTGTLPSFKCTSTEWPHIKDILLADPQFNEPGPVDILFGADVTSSILREGVKHGPRLTPIAQNTALGWVLSGKVKTNSESVIRVHHVSCEVDTILRKFWELEELPAKKHLTCEEKRCEQHFMETVTRISSGRYVVQLPLTSEVDNLGLSRDLAIARLKQVERRLESKPQMKTQYADFMREYIQLGHMEQVPQHQVNDRRISSYYLPHHCVIREDSSTTKLRVVFDGSAKTTSGVSLNDCIMVGPTVQDDVFSLLLRFRLHPIALKADIAKFFRQVDVDQSHRDYQRIVWRESQSEPIRDFRLRTVTYGTACDPYLSTRALQQLTEDEKSNYREACSTIARDCYVDDLMSGAGNLEEAIFLQQQLCKLLATAGMELRKWSSNNELLLQSIPPELRETNESLSLDSEKAIKALGVKWNTKTDTFIFEVPEQQQTVKVTKRSVLSQLAKVFDPLGWLSPVTINAKLLFQELWKHGLNWDDSLPESNLQQWDAYQSELSIIKNIQIPRCIVPSQNVKFEMHGFCDASEKAYGAAVYLRCMMDSGEFQVRLVTAKTKVAPLKQVSLPRLELCGAVVLAKLLISTKQALQLDCECYGWTDSTIVLGWLNSNPGRWKTFVANRVSEIQDLISADKWSHVRSEENPADCCSRGIPASELENHHLWWTGPEWLVTNTFPSLIVYEDVQQVNLEEKKKVEFAGHISLDSSFISKFSKLNKLKRVTAYILRFINNIKGKKSDRLVGELTCKELQSALNHCVREVQSTTFGLEIENLKNSKKISSKSKILQLNPFLDGNNILRVGGRIQKADIPDERKHQIILPHNHHFTRLLIDNFHKANHHAGFQLLWATMQREFWILRARDTIRHYIRQCVICRKRRAETMQQLMGSLPKSRVNIGQPFQHCGVDYAGPFWLHTVRGRGKKPFKGYFSIFVCMVTKAVHLEAVCDMTSESFLAAFKRFTSRRGLSSDIYSDCGSNFKGADNELKKLLESADHNRVVSDHLTEKGTNWHFNPPESPHHGGLWEAGVKSVKFHLRRIVGGTILTLEEFQTILCQIESCLNSRPLCAMSSDYCDYNVLTPGHFLIGQPLNASPEPDLSTIKMNRLSRWQQTQQMFQHFWRRWSSEYLSTLQQRFKWKEQRDNVQIGDLVLVKDDNLPPLKWKLARVIDVHPGEDSSVRVVTVKTATGEFKRPIVKLCPVLSSNE